MPDGADSVVPFEETDEAEDGSATPTSEVAILKAATAGLLDKLPLEDVVFAAHAVQDRVTNELTTLCERIEQGHALHADQWAELLDVAREALQPLLRDDNGLA